VTPLEEHKAALAEALAARERAGLPKRAAPSRGIDLASNDYLGLAQHPRVVEGARAAAAALGAGSGGSRMLAGRRDAFTDLEERLAAFTGAEAALLFGSRYLANVGLLQAVVGWDDLVIADHRNHPSLMDGTRLTGARKVVHPHRDLAAIAAALREPRAGRAFVVTESVYGMDGDLTPLADLVDVADRYGAVVIVDEAHATGLYGARGSGRVEELGLAGRVLATVHSGGKALGSAGAWVSGSRLLVDTLVQAARTFMFTTAPMPAMIGALDAALDVVAQEPERRADVHRKAALLRAALADAALPAGAGPSVIIPLHVGENEAAVQLSEALRGEGFDCRAVRPPAVPDGAARLRITVRAPVPDDDLLRFARAAARLMPPSLKKSHRDTEATEDGKKRLPEQRTRSTR
jgi:8-amino-7-oxononanoate synthase